MILAGALAAVVAVLVGCGSDDGQPVSVPVVTEPVPVEGAEDFDASADKLCTEAMAEQESIRRDVGGVQLTLGDRARLLVDLAPVRVELATDLAELELPENASDAELAEALVLSARRRGTASTLAGRRWQEDEGRQAIAAAAAREHDERVRFVEIATELGMEECAEILPEDAIEEIADSLGTALTDPDPGERCSRFGKRYLAQEYEGGGEDECAAADAGAPRSTATKIELTEAQGIADVFAVARVTTDGPDGEVDYRARMTFEGGRYKIDKLD